HDPRTLGSSLKRVIPIVGLSESRPSERHGIFFEKALHENELLPRHQHELSEKKFQLEQNKMNFSTKITNGEVPRWLKQQARHLPFLLSANLSLGIFRGSEEIFVTTHRKVN
uniref:Uncharacterized protein n=1 Tax=Ursus maritimus TaxID=29073 RepID=A0A452UST7_URSMA